MKLDFTATKARSTFSVGFKADHIIHLDSETPQYIGDVYKPRHYFTTKVTCKVHCRKNSLVNNIEQQPFV